MSNTIGTAFRVTSFGESHGPCIGVVADGCPAGLEIGAEDMQSDLSRRRAEGQPGATARQERDVVRFLSGVYQGRTTGAPLCMIVENRDVESGSYMEMVGKPRPGHADYPAGVKYDGFNDPRGGGRFSGRVTAGFVMAGAVARLVLREIGVEVDAHTIAIGGVEAPTCAPDMIRVCRNENGLSCCDEASAARMAAVIERAREQGDSVGGVVECAAHGLPTGIGQPVFSSIESEVAHAVFAIPAVKGIEFGGGFAMCRMRGSEANDPFVMREGRVVTGKNDSGGVLGGLSTGMPLVLRVAFKPTPSVGVPQRTVDLEGGTETELIVRGRHDSCIVPRAVVVVEAMVAIALCDLALMGGFIPRLMRCR